MWKRQFAVWIDRIAVPAAAAVVGWIVMSAWVVPHAPAWLPDPVLNAVGAAAAFAIAWRTL